MARSLSSARVEMNPHQVEASLFALRSPLSKGVLLADEVGLGKTIEAGLVIAQRWAERKKRILLIVPASLRKQWEQELWDKFSLRCTILDAAIYKAAVKSGKQNPFEADDIVICSYEFAAGKADQLAMVPWNLVVYDEAHRLRNVYKKDGAKRAKQLRDALQAPFKVLLTATPLQNSLMELYGITSMIDPTHFGGEAAFRTQFAGARSTAGSMEVLRERVSHICHRTLRRQVVEAGHINFTKRHPETFSFEPSNKEVELYEKVSEFLKRKDTISYGDKANQLVVLQVRKILGSSTFAVTGYLRQLIARLEAKMVVDETITDDIETIDELGEEYDDEAVSEAAPDVIDPDRLDFELNELRGFLSLADEIGSNAKGDMLLRKLPAVLEEIHSKGGQRKAVIFTESVRTQTYLNTILTDHGFHGKTVLLNGSNADPESREIYNQWKAKHAGTDKISGSRSADMKAALVEAFKSDDKAIMIATESGAEGINLQFCSLIVNFDLPWNPQRVEQRIGRCHRYGQKIDVTVVNMLNLKNATEARIHELLTEKFHLFEGVFGSSDEVLGAIGQGVDFEKRVVKIVQNCRNEFEVQSEFDDLQAELQTTIDADMDDARAKVLENMDERVVQHLKDRQGILQDMLDDFTKRITLVARAELATANFHGDDSPRFDYEGQTFTTKWPEADDNDWQFFRLQEESLGAQIVEKAKARDHSLETTPLIFKPSEYPFPGQLGDVNDLVGKSGWLRVSKARLDAAEAVRENLLLSCLADDGSHIDEKTADRMLMVPSALSADALPTMPDLPLGLREEGLFSEFRDNANKQNVEWLDEEQERLDNYARDIEIEIDVQIDEMEDRAKQLRRDGRMPGLAMEEKLSLSRERKKLEAEIDDMKMTKHERRKEIRRKVEDMLDDIADSLNKTPELTHLFTVRWQVV